MTQIYFKKENQRPISGNKPQLSQFRDSVDSILPLKQQKKLHLSDNWQWEEDKWNLLLKPFPISDPSLSFSVWDIARSRLLANPCNQLRVRSWFSLSKVLCWVHGKISPSKRSNLTPSCPFAHRGCNGSKQSVPANRCERATNSQTACWLIDCLITHHWWSGCELNQQVSEHLGGWTSTFGYWMHPLRKPWHHSSKRRVPLNSGICPFSLAQLWCSSLRFSCVLRLLFFIMRNLTNWQIHQGLLFLGMPLWIMISKSRWLHFQHLFLMS